MALDLRAVIAGMSKFFCSAVGHQSMQMLLDGILWMETGLNWRELISGVELLEKPSKAYCI